MNKYFLDIHSPAFFTHFPVQSQGEAGAYLQYLCERQGTIIVAT